MINNYFAITFLTTIIFYIINFECHQCHCKPNICDYSFGYINSINIRNGSIFIGNIHIHHWIIGCFVLFIFLFLSESIFKSIITGIASAAIVDGLCFADRFHLIEDIRDNKNIKNISTLFNLG